MAPTGTGLKYKRVSRTLPNAREYFKKKKELESKGKIVSVDEAASVKKEIRRYRILKFYKILAVLVVLGIIGTAAYFYLQNREYKEYEVQTDVKREDTVTTQYMEFQGKILKYNKDGVSYCDAQNNTLWAYTYEMQSPTVDICENMAAVGDIKGTKLFIFDSDGNQGEINTNFPIQKFRVSELGTVAVVLEDGDTTWINIYDKSGGEALAKNKTSLDISGYPVDIDISNDNTRVIVSYLQLDGGALKTHVAFYNFGSVGQNYTDKLVSGKIVDGVLFPRTAFIDNEHAVAFGDDRFLIFEGKQIPELLAEVPLEEGEQLVDIFYDKTHIGIVVTSADNASKYSLRIYNPQGNLMLTQKLATDFDRIKIYDDQLLMFYQKQFSVFNLKGVEKFTGTMTRNILDIIPKNKGSQFIVVDSSNTRQIKLK